MILQAITPRDNLSRTDKRECLSARVFTSLLLIAHHPKEIFDLPEDADTGNNCEQSSSSELPIENAELKNSPRDRKIPPKEFRAKILRFISRVLLSSLKCVMSAIRICLQPQASVFNLPPAAAAGSNDNSWSDISDLPRLRHWLILRKSLDHAFAANLAFFEAFYAW